MRIDDWRLTIDKYRYNVLKIFTYQCFIFDRSDRFFWNSFLLFRFPFLFLHFFHRVLEILRQFLQVWNSPVLEGKILRRQDKLAFGVVQGQIAQAEALGAEILQCGHVGRRNEQDTVAVRQMKHLAAQLERLTRTAPHQTAVRKVQQEHGVLMLNHTFDSKHINTTPILQEIPAEILKCSRFESFCPKYYVKKIILLFWIDLDFNLTLGRSKKSGIMSADIQMIISDDPHIHNTPNQTRHCRPY